MSSEKTPLLGPETSSRQVLGYGDGGSSGVPGTSQNVYVPAIGPDELPPPYTSLPHNDALMISCKVCNSMIDITGKRDQHVAKCMNCKEATPVRSAPTGKKYVRCPCNCLLICRSNADRIACPRLHCSRIINLTSVTSMPTSPSLPGMCQVSCAHCHNLFLFKILSSALARCPHCKNVSAVGSNSFAKRRGIIYILLFILSLIALATATATTYTRLKPYGGFYVLYIGLAILAIFFLIRSIWFFERKVSAIEGPA